MYTTLNKLRSVSVSVSVSVLYSTETPFGYYVEGGVGETLAARFP